MHTYVNSVHPRDLDYTETLIVFPTICAYSDRIYTYIKINLSKINTFLHYECFIGCHNYFWVQTSNYCIYLDFRTL